MAIEAMQFIQDLSKKYHYTHEGITGNPAEAFQTGKIGMAVHGDWLTAAHPTTDNFAVALTTNRKAPISRAFLNSMIVAVSETLATLGVDAMAGDALARLEFPGRRLVFGVIIASIMVPFQVTLVPLYLMFVQAGWLNTYQALVLPGLSRAFGVFLMRQFFLTLPRDVARIDRASPLAIFTRITLPLVRPALAALEIFTLLRRWNEFT